MNAAATGANIGTSWAMAYNDLQVALARADKGCGTEIRVAHGTYKPGTTVTTSFTIPAGVSVYGGFAGNETARDQRDWNIHKTILSGYIGKDEFQNDLRNRTVVTMGDNSLLDGITIKEGDLRGIFGEDVEFTIANCVIEENLQYGIRSKDSNASIEWCTIRNNGFDGIFQDGNSKTIGIDNCQISNNGQNGINVYLSVPTIRNSVLSSNGSSASNYCGIYLDHPSGISVVRNNTIVFNENEGIRSVGTNNPSIRNCILWGNNAAGEQLTGYQVNYYSCVYDPNNPQGTSTPDANGNITCNPKFAYDDPELNNFHLAADSPCIDMGNNTGIGQNERDIDNTDRIYNSIVDMGADEVDCSDVFNACDLTADGVVNMDDFYSISRAWMTYDPNNPLCDPNNPNYVSDPNSTNYISQTDKDRFDTACDWDSDLDVDLDDLMTFADNWLWIACWRLDLQEMQMSIMTMGESLVQPILSAESTISPKAVQKPIHEQIVELRDTVRFLEKLWLEDQSIQQEIDAGDWRQFMEKVYQNMSELQNIESNKINVKEVEQ